MKSSSTGLAVDAAPSAPSGTGRRETHAGPRGLRDRHRRRSVILHLTLLLCSLVFVLPLLLTLSGSVQTDQEIYDGLGLIPDSVHLDNYTNAWSEAGFGRSFVNSVVYTTVVVFAVVALGSIAAYAFARMRFPGRSALFYAFLVLVAFPLPGAFIPLYVLLVNLNLVNTPVGYVLPLINANLPVAIFILRSFFIHLPHEIEEAALLDGAGRWTVFRRIALPLARPAIATVVILTALSVWNEFLLALVVLNDETWMPLQVGLMTFQGTYFSRYSLMMAATVITMAPAVLAYLVFQRYIIKGIMTGGVRG